MEAIMQIETPLHTDPQLDQIAGQLQGPLDQIVVEWGAFNLEKPRQCPPVSPHVGNGLPQGTVGFDQAIRQLLIEPKLEFVHQ